MDIIFQYKKKSESQQETSEFAITYSQNTENWRRHFFPIVLTNKDIHKIIKKENQRYLNLEYIRDFY
jgi:hypothetical protein